jgi:hypothetical protein
MNSYLYIMLWNPFVPAAFLPLSLFSPGAHSDSNSLILSQHNIFQRQAGGRALTCTDSGASPCTQAGAPANFCCEPNAACLLLAGNTTVICCPTGSTCDVIQSIRCDTANATNSNGASAGSFQPTALLSGLLPACFDKCCPFGYNCGSQG